MHKQLVRDVAERLWVADAMHANDDLTLIRSDFTARYRALDDEARMKHELRIEQVLETFAAVLLAGSA